MSKAGKRRRFFDRGVAALTAINADPPGHYGCPQCFTAFAADALQAEPALLTLEHVPPRSIGGKEITLTCERCNSNAGLGPEGAMHKRDLVDNFVTGDYGEAVMKWAQGGQVVTARVKRSPGRYEAIAMPEHSDPVQQAALEQHLERGADNDQVKLTMTVRFDPRAAAMSDLRTGYLAAFAKLGYRYVSHPMLSPVREQLMRPKERLLTPVQFSVRGAERTTRAIGIWVAPVSCLCVQVWRRLTLLPWPLGGFDLYAATDLPHFSPGETISWKGQMLSWPTGMDLALDFDQPLT